MTTPKPYGWKEIAAFFGFGALAFFFGLIAGNKTACVQRGLPHISKDTLYISFETPIQRPLRYHFEKDHGSGELIETSSEVWKWQSMPIP